MSQLRLNEFVMELYDLLKQMVEVESLHDHEIASILKVSKSLISKLRNAYGIKKADGFHRRFESTYGKWAIEKFKKMIENPDNSLTDVGRHFGFSKEYARYVYKKIYGHAYTEAYKRKRQARKAKRLSEKRQKSKQMKKLIKVRQKLESMGLNYTINKKGRSYTILTNGYTLGVRRSSTPVMIGKKRYFRYNNQTWSNEDYDFIICLCKNGKEDIHFIIPSKAMPKSIISLLPEATPRESKYAQFREAWNLLKNKNPKAFQQPPHTSSPPPFR